MSKKLSKTEKDLLPRCNAVYGEHVCELELGHGNGYTKHRQEGVTWTDAGAKRELEENKVKSS